MSVLETLIQKNIVSQTNAQEILDEAETSGVTVEQVLLKRGIDPEDILRAKGEELDIPTRSIKNKQIPGKILAFIPEESANYYRFVPIGVKDGVLEVGIVDPDNIEGRDALNFISSKLNMPFKIFLITDQDFEEVISQYKGLSGEVTKALSELETELKGSQVHDEDDAGGETP